MSVTTWVAIYGAVVSTLVFGWNLYRDLRERPRLQLKCSVARLVGGPTVTKPKLHLRITNAGRSQTWITNVGGRRGRQEAFVLVPTNRLPMKLEPGQLIDETGNLSELKDPEGILYFSASDSTGKTFKSGILDTWRVIDHMLEAMGKDDQLGVSGRMRNLLQRTALRLDPRTWFEG